MRIFFFVLACVLLPAILTYALGWWALPACMLGVVVLCLTSSRQGQGHEAARGGSLTRYETGLHTEF